MKPVPKQVSDHPNLVAVSASSKNTAAVYLHENRQQYARSNLLD
jgi:hypothetical protein